MSFKTHYFWEFVPCTTPQWLPQAGLRIPPGENFAWFIPHRLTSSYLLLQDIKKILCQRA